MIELLLEKIDKKECVIGIIGLVYVGLPLIREFLETGSSVLYLGLAYKKDVDDTRESPSLRLIDLMLSEGQLSDTMIPIYQNFLFLP